MQLLLSINNLKISKLLYGYRGKAEGDINALVETVLKLGKFVEKNSVWFGNVRGFGSIW